MPVGGTAQTLTELFEGRGGGGGKDNVWEQGKYENFFYYYYFGEHGNNQVYFRGTREHVPPGRASTILYMFKSGQRKSRRKFSNLMKDTKCVQ